MKGEVYPNKSTAAAGRRRWKAEEGKERRRRKPESHEWHTTTPYNPSRQAVGRRWQPHRARSGQLVYLGEIASDK
jgi:hypothetical protein